MAIGQSAQWGDLLKGTKVELRPNGGAIADPVTLQTAEPDIFVGGDIYHGAKFAIDAIADGREAMVSINRFVHPVQSLTIGRDRREFIEFDREDITRPESFDNSPRQRPGMKPGEARETFRDLRLPLTEEQVEANAKTYVEQAAKVLDMDKTTIVHNGDWLKPLDLTKMLHLMSQFNVARILEREDFHNRYENQ
jgi:hypothetical protein